MSNDTLHISMETANRIFTRAQSQPDAHLLGVVRAADSAAQTFEVADSEDLAALSPGPQDIPVVHTHAVANFVSDRLLTVITDTRGVMQLKAYRRHDDDIEDLVINTEDD